MAGAAGNSGGTSSLGGSINIVAVWGGERAPSTVWLKMAARSRKSLLHMEEVEGIWKQSAVVFLDI